MNGISPLRLVTTDPLAGSKRKTPPPLPPQKPSILNLEEADRFKNLLLFAKSKVEGYFSGKHKSPYYGSNVEFADYQEYVPGEDIGNIDWRVYGRTRKLFLRKYEEETDMVAYIVVDTSGSMQFRGSGKDSKFQHAIKIAAVLAYLMIRQGDKASLTLFAEKVKKFIPPGGTRRHLYNLVNELEAATPSARTAISASLGECASVFKKRGCVILISDFLGDSTHLFDALGQFIHRKYEVLLLQVVDPDELDLPNTSVARFVDMETGEHVEVEPEEIRRAYRDTMRQFVDGLGADANQRRMRHSRVDTSNPYISAIEAWIGFRGQGGHR